LSRDNGPFLRRPPAHTHQPTTRAFRSRAGRSETTQQLVYGISLAAAGALKKAKTGLFLDKFIQID
jgi:hypothetical protein